MKKKRGARLIFERGAPWCSHASIECSSSAFRKLGTLAPGRTHKAAFHDVAFAFRSPNKRKNKKKKTFLDPRIVFHRVFRDYSRPPRSLSISKFNASDERTGRRVARTASNLLDAQIYFSILLFFFYYISSIDFYTATES